MIHDRLTRDLFAEICRIPFIDPHSHIDPRRPVSRSLDDILGYHYYTELAHSAGMDQAPLAADADPKERVRSILAHLDRIDNTSQYSWFLEIARTFLGFKGDRVTEKDADALWDAGQRVFRQPDWEHKVLHASNLEKIFLTNDFDDPLEGFDKSRYVPCLRTDDVVFHLDNPQVRERVRRATGIEPLDAQTLDNVLGRFFERFTKNGAKACAISLPPSFAPRPVDRGDFSRALAEFQTEEAGAAAGYLVSHGVFWALAEHCRRFRLPFDLMIGVNRAVYPGGVHQGRDLFDQRTSLIQYAELFNAFPEVTFCVSVLSSGQNQELVSYCWIFPNVITSGHWWYSNVPAYITQDCRARLQAAPKTKQLGYYSDAYKLEFVLPKYNMYRRVLAQILADDFVRPGVYTETQAVDLARMLLRDNARRIFGV
ncbi:MAG: glucuronate isomerase [Planctomycetes bacterium]|nr:glucuronate isomerase [Planctomycetota bacterium]